MSNDDVARRHFLQSMQTSEPPLRGSPLSEAAWDFVFGKVWDSPLSYREKRLISLTCACISAHNLGFETHVRAALQSGDFTVEDLQAVSVHLAAYAGFPVGAGFETMVQKVKSELGM